MQVEVKIDAAYPEPKVIVLTDEMKEQVSEILSRLSDAQPQMIVGYEEDSVKNKFFTRKFVPAAQSLQGMEGMGIKKCALDQEEIIRVYAAGGRVYAVTEKKREYRLRLRLYEAEERLDQNRFVRISNSEIINLKMVRHFDLSITGTICVSFKNDMKTYVSRRYVAKVKQKLGI